MWPRRTGRKRRQAPGSPLYFSVVEPGTTALRVLVVEVAEGQSTIWGWAEGPGWSGLGDDTPALVEACRSASAQAEQMAQDLAGFWFLPDQMLVGLPAAMLRGWAWPIMQRRSRPEQPIEERELAALLERTLRLAINRLESMAGGEPEAGGDDWLLVEAVPVSLSVDGRGVTDPVGFRGQELGAMVFAALASAGIIARWGEVARELEFSTLTLTAAPLALAASMSEVQGLLLDVGGSTTDLNWFRAGRPVALGSLSTGGETLTDSLRSKWSLSWERAERLKRAFGDGRLGEEAKEQVLAVLTPALQAWREEVETALASMNPDEPLPQQLYLLGGGAALPALAETARSLAWSRRLSFVRYPQVRRLRPTDVPGVINRTDLGRAPGDESALALAAWAAQQVKPPDRPARILHELCRE